MVKKPSKPKRTTKKAAAKGRRAPAKRAGKKRKAPAKADLWSSPEDRRTFFDPLDMLRKVLTSSDMLFLSRQIAYHMASASELPQAFGDPERTKQVLTKLIEHLVKKAPRRSNISMELKTHSLRRGPGVEIRMQGTDRFSEKRDASALMATLYSPEPDDESGVVLAKLRETMLGMRGRMWVDLPKPNNPIYHIVLPTTKEALEAPHAEHQTFKYDIHIMNFANVRKRFGIRKSASLVEQIERYVKSLVRYPMDMVMSLTEKGIITTIYETQGGGAESVASRISQKLGREAFHIGRRPVELTFRYKLSTLAVTPSGRAKAKKKGRR